MTKPPRIILGINSAYHESAAALVVDGRLVAALEEERFSGRKHGKTVRVDNAHHLPLAAMDYCLEEAGIGWSDVDAIGYSLDPGLRWELARVEQGFSALEFGSPLGEAAFQRSIARIPHLLRKRTPAHFHFVRHHLGHAWYALGTSPFDRAAVLVMDGIGEGASVSLGWGDRTRISLEKQVLFPRSLGLAWEKVACFLGLTEYDACKVMALAGLVPRQENDGLVPHLNWKDTGLEMDQTVFNLEYPRDFAGLERHFGCSRQDAASDPTQRIRVASALQQATEKLLLAVAGELHATTGEGNLAYAGGVALNCRANAELAGDGPFANIHIGPAAHDAGTALGAAWYLHAALTGEAVPEQEASLILGAGPDAWDRGAPSGWRRRDGWDALGILAQRLADGEPVAWLDGRCEFGPRALGRRSLLASAHDPEVARRINTLKGRQEFEPLALSVPLERADQLFDIPTAGRGLAEYMLITVRPRPEWHGRLAHLLHGDGTVRLQTVERCRHRRFHDLLRAVERHTGLPLLVNTSLNPRGLPMPATERQAWSWLEPLGLRHACVNGVYWSADYDSSDHPAALNGPRSPDKHVLHG